LPAGLNWVGAGSRLAPREARGTLQPQASTYGTLALGHLHQDRGNVASGQKLGLEIRFPLFFKSGLNSGIADVAKCQMQTLSATSYTHLTAPINFVVVLAWWLLIWLMPGDLQCFGSLYSSYSCP